MYRIQYRTSAAVPIVITPGEPALSAINQISTFSSAHSLMVMPPPIVLPRFTVLTGMRLECRRELYTSVSTFIDVVKDEHSPKSRSAPPVPIGFPLMMPFGRDRF